MSGEQVNRGPSEQGDIFTAGERNPYSMWKHTIRPVASFWVLPAVILLGFIVLGIALRVLEGSNIPAVQSLRSAISRHLFSDHQTTREFLGAVGGGLLTLTTLTFTLLMVVLQEAAGELGHLIYDQFLGRKGNQVYAGYLMGTIVLAFVIQSSVSESFNPILGAFVVLVTLVLSVLFMAMFVYFVADQMRMETIAHTMREQTLEAREHQMDLLNRTRRTAALRGGESVMVRSAVEGTLVRIDADQLEELLAPYAGTVEVDVRAHLGSHVAYHDPIAVVRSHSRQDARTVAESLGSALRFAARRQAAEDAGYGVQQLDTLAYTAASPSKHNAEVSQWVAHVLRDLLIRWMRQPEKVAAEGEVLPVVYEDHLISNTLDALQTMMVMSAESHQHLTMSTALISLADVYPYLTPPLRQHAREIVIRTIPQLERVPFVHELDVALSTLARTFEQHGSPECAGLVREARADLASHLPVSLEPPPPGNVESGSPELAQEAD